MTWWQAALNLLLAIALAAGWYKYSTAVGKLRRAAGLFLWIAPLTVGVLAPVHDRIGDRALLVVSVLLLAAALVALRAVSPAGEAGDLPARLAASLLILGSLMVWVGAVTWPGMELEQVAAHRLGHLLTAGWFLLGALATLAGFTVLHAVLRDAGDRFFSQLGLVAFLFGAVCWGIHLAFRLTVMPHVAQHSLAAAPDWYQPLRLWSGALYAIYMTLAFLAIAAFGAAMQRTGWAGRGWGRTFVIFGLAATAGFIARLGAFDLPLVVPFMPYAMGMLLLRKVAAKTQWAVGSRQ